MEFHKIGATTEKALLLASIAPTSTGNGTCKVASPMTKGDKSVYTEEGVLSFLQHLDLV